MPYYVYRIGPFAQLLKLAVPFLLDPVVDGGLGLSTEQVGGIYGTAGTAAFLVGSPLTRNARSSRS